MHIQALSTYSGYITAISHSSLIITQGYNYLHSMNASNIVWHCCQYILENPLDIDKNKLYVPTAQRITYTMQQNFPTSTRQELTTEEEEWIHPFLNDADCPEKRRYEQQQARELGNRLLNEFKFQNSSYTTDINVAVPVSSWLMAFFQGVDGKAARQEIAKASGSAP